MFIPTGHLIDMAIGSGARLTDGPGLGTSPGVGRLTIMAAGFITTTRGHGARAVVTTGIAVGGDQH
jgi:hypothetical protein